jgi:hypothetical protein
VRKRGKREITDNPCPDIVRPTIVAAMTIAKYFRTPLSPPSSPSDKLKSIFSSWLNAFFYTGGFSRRRSVP